MHKTQFFGHFWITVLMAHLKPETLV